jgi:hypothetical protein
MPVRKLMGKLVQRDIACFGKRPKDVVFLVGDLDALSDKVFD